MGRFSELNSKKEIEERRQKRALRERTFIMGATSIPNEEMQENNEVDPVEWASKFFESNEYKELTKEGKQSLREGKEKLSEMSRNPQDYKLKIAKLMNDLADIVGDDEAAEYIKDAIDIANIPYDSFIEAGLQ